MKQKTETIKLTVYVAIQYKSHEEREIAINRAKGCVLSQRILSTNSIIPLSANLENTELLKQKEALVEFIKSLTTEVDELVHSEIKKEANELLNSLKK